MPVIQSVQLVWLIQFIQRNPRIQRAHALRTLPVAHPRYGPGPEQRRPPSPTGRRAGRAHPDRPVRPRNDHRAGLGRPTSLKQGSTNYASSIAWHPNCKISSLTRGNGDVFTQSLNPRQLVSFIGSNIGADLSYSYNAKGQVSSIDSAGTDRDRTFSYDGAGRLKTASGPWGTGSYQYDPLNNLTQKTLGSRVVDIEYTTTNRVNRVRDTAISSSWRTYSHDARGNVTNDGIHGFVYDFANQPIAISGLDSGSYQYDGHLRRVKQVVNGQTIYSVYDLSGALLTRDNASSSEKTDYLSIAGQTFVRVKNNVASYPLNDHLGTAFALATQSGSIPGNQSYNTTPFGEAWGANAPIDEQGFTGHVEDATELTYMQARYYDPVIGRFLSPDPIGYADQLNLYAYVGNDPVNSTDPTGMACFTMAAVMGSTCSYTGQVPELALGPPKTFRKESEDNAVSPEVAVDSGNTFTEMNDKQTEEVLLTQASAIADNLGAPGGDAEWKYSGVDSIDCGGTGTYACTTNSTQIIDGKPSYRSSIEYGRGTGSPGTSNIVWRAGQAKLMIFNTGLERAVFVTLHERAHVAQAGRSPFNREFLANKEATQYYEIWLGQ